MKGAAGLALEDIAPPPPPRRGLRPPRARAADEDTVAEPETCGSPRGLRIPAPDLRRDWANLPSELLEEIAGRLLTIDILEYLRFRSACKPWRKCTDDPSLLGSGLDPRFRPHNWIAVPHCASPSLRCLINIRTGARAEVDRPALSTHRCFGIVDGLLVLCDEATGCAVRLLNPLTGAVAYSPAITDVRDTRPTPSATVKALAASRRPLTKEEIRAIIMTTPKVQVPADPSVINGAAIDDSTSPPTLVLALRRQVRRIICAKPGDQHWVAVHFGEQQEPFFNADGEIVFHTLLSFRRHCYVATCRGDVMRVDLRKPRMVYLYREMALSSETSAYSYLVRSQDHRMLMVRHLSHIDLTQDCYQRSEIFTSQDGVHSCMEVLEVDVVGRRLIPLNGIGKYAAFIGQTYSIILPSDKFSELAPNAVYLNFFRQEWCHFGIYHFKDRRISLPREFTQGAHRNLSPCACHWELADYLIHDIERW
ncbi:hypothetical protein C2845_PM03G31660 [Panicum miliaceum]|uniref:Uncharacterized protein n=1 Tax=Panicum miliaceum TaxID=4540 RepID=A0A3L6TDH9_PANMI|nr:hypothetical protein C2845_PM03G31660 [Panicum miliaceum]